MLFSGGLDSVLASRILQDMGLRVLCLHFVSPFFGDASKIWRWKQLYRLEIEAVDASREFTAMLAGWPAHGVGKTLNPCVDCKILLLKLAGRIMRECGAAFAATGEVLGQRPMSQRLDTLNAIARDSGLKGKLLRPLSALLLPPTQMELSGLCQTEKLLKISGRGRLAQLALAEKFGLKEIPSPGGGCLLTEKTSAARYWPLLKPFWEDCGHPDAAKLASDFRAINHGRVLFRLGYEYWMGIGRNERDNGMLARAAAANDLVLKLPFPGPLALCRDGKNWNAGILREACAVFASYAPAKRLTGDEVDIIVTEGNDKIRVRPQRHEKLWNLPEWEIAHEAIKSQRGLRGKPPHSASARTAVCKLDIG